MAKYGMTRDGIYELARRLQKFLFHPKASEEYALRET